MITLLFSMLKFRFGLQSFMESGPSCDIPDLESLRRNLAQSLSANQWTSGGAATLTTLEIFHLLWHTLPPKIVVIM